MIIPRQFRKIQLDQKKKVKRKHFGLKLDGYYPTISDERDYKPLNFQLGRKIAILIG